MVRADDTIKLFRAAPVLFRCAGLERSGTSGAHGVNQKVFPSVFLAIQKWIYGKGVGWKK